MATASIGKKVSFEIVSPYSDDFMGSVNTLRNEARKNNKTGMSLAEINKIIKSTRKEKNKSRNATRAVETHWKINCIF